VRKTRIPYVTWNIERGVQYDRIVDALEALKPDIVILQEVDRYCRRSGNRDVASDLARTAGILVYSVHLESGGTDALRQRQLAEAISTTARRFLQSFRELVDRGFVDPFASVIGDRRTAPAHPQPIDCVFLRRIAGTDGHIVRNTGASDHDPLVLTVAR